ncbi:MAG: endonuclease NucS [Aigarchaeota archaeon]|nr:endonuclease NucS [Aigarchaeota archaeon]MDW7986070.1 endonuclease NucS [Nitrososphaerota archaeon]
MSGLVDPVKIAEKLKDSLLKREVIILVGLFEVSYEGRASSILGLGERVLMIKSDHSIIIHRPTSYEPVNWQPPNSKIEVNIVDGRLTIIARRPKPSEILIVRFNEVYHYSSFKLRDEAEFYMYATEEDMKQAILMHPSLIEEGFKPVEDERKIHPSGFIDIFGVDASGRLVVVEIKRREASIEDIRQLVYYVDSIERELGSRPRAVIAAPSIQKSATRELTLHNVEYKCISPKKCLEILKKTKGLDRFTF